MLSPEGSSKVAECIVWSSRQPHIQLFREGFPYRVFGIILAGYTQLFLAGSKCKIDTLKLESDLTSLALACFTYFCSNFPFFVYSLKLFVFIFSQETKWIRPQDEQPRKWGQDAALRTEREVFVRQITEALEMETKTEIG